MEKIEFNHDLERSEIIHAVGAGVEHAFSFGGDHVLSAIQSGVREAFLIAFNNPDFQDKLVKEISRSN